MTFVAGELREALQDQGFDTERPMDRVQFTKAILITLGAGIVILTSGDGFMCSCLGFCNKV